MKCTAKRPSRTRPTPDPLPPVAASMLRATLAGGGGAIQQVVIRFAPELDPDRVVAAWAETVGATEALHTGFVVRNGSPVGITRRQPTGPLRIENGGPGTLGIWLAEDRLCPLPLATGVPWRCTWWPAQRLWVWTFHHALLDGRSITAILRGFRQRLEGDRRPATLGLKKWSAPDAARIDAAGAYYQAAFAPLQSFVLDFPDGPPGPRDCLHRHLGATTADALEFRAAEIGVTAPAILTWAWGQAAALAAGLDAVAIGQVRAGPPQDDRAGFSMNTLPVVVRRCADSNPTPALRAFRAQLHHLREFENIAPDNLPGVDFARHGGPWRGGVVMVERGTLAEQVGTGEAFASLEMHERGGEPLLACARLRPDLELEVEFDGRVHGPAAAGAMLDIWDSIITAIARREDDPVRLPRAMRETLAARESGGPPAAVEHLAQAWKDRVAEHAHQPALIATGRTLSYADLDRRAEHLAARLEMHGVTTGTVVAAELADRAWFPVVLLATARLDAILLPLDPDLPPARRAALVADARPALRITDFPDDPQRYDLPRLVPDWSGADARATAMLPDDPGATLAILYTSGSTGAPKGVRMSHGGVVNEAIAIGRLAGLAPGRRLLQFASPGFDAALEEVLATLLLGGALVPRPDHLKTDLHAFHEFVSAEMIDVVDLPTAHWAAWCSWMVAEGKRIPENLRTTIIGGERAAGTTLGEWFRSGGGRLRLLNTYGPTEASVVATVEIIESPDTDPEDPPIGRPLPGVRARVANPAGRPLPPGAAGEIWLGGVCIGPGYWKRRDLTAEKFIEHDGQRWYRTGDRARWLPDGRLQFLGRIDDQLKIRGNRIEPAEVMRVLESFPGVSATHVGPHPRPDGSLALAAWIRWNATPPPHWPAALAIHVAASLPRAAVPSRWSHVDRFVLTERGKIDRSQLPEPDLTAARDRGGEPPATSTEKKLATIWRELLDLPEIHRDDSFFDLGGDSIAALKLFSHIHRAFGRHLPMARLAEAPTLRGLSSLLDAPDPAADRDPRSPVMQTLRPGGGPPLFCLHGGDGGVLFYREFAAALDIPHPVIALESPALASADGRPAPGVADMAADYLSAIRERQPTGPYHLLGYSFGGLLAYEIASQLRASGQEVALATIVDTLHPGAPVRAYSPAERARVCWASHSGASPSRRLARLLIRAAEGVATHLRVRRELRAASRATDTEPHSALRLVRLREAHRKAALNYRPKPLDDLRLVLIRSEVDDDKCELPDDYGWSAAVGEPEILHVPGRHLEIFNSAHTPAIARVVSRLVPSSGQSS